MFPPIIWSLPNRGHTSPSTTDAWRMPRVMATAFSHPKATAFGVLPYVPEPRVEAIRHVCSTAWRQDAGVSPIWRRSRLSYSPSFGKVTRSPSPKPWAARIPCASGGKCKYRIGSTRPLLN